MDKRTQILAQIQEQGLLPLYFHPDEELSLNAMKALYQAGIRTLEYTNRGKEALKNFKKMRQLCDAELKGMHLGIGTIKDAAMASAFIDAGADFVVSPGLAEDVYDITYSNKILWIPGCMTPTEIMRAEQYGINCIKLFPGVLLGPAYLKAIMEVFPGILFMPTGGVKLEVENLRAWFDAGVCAVGMGSGLISKAILEQKEYSFIITKLANQALELIAAVRK